MKLSEEQKERLGQAFEKLLEIESLQEFSRLWKEEGRDAAISYLDLSDEDFDAFGEYLKEFEPPHPLQIFWYPIPV